MVEKIIFYVKFNNYYVFRNFHFVINIVSNDFFGNTLNFYALHLPIFQKPDL